MTYDLLKSMPTTGHRELFGVAPCLDDVPHRVTDINGHVWVQAYLDTVECFAIYTRQP